MENSLITFDGDLTLMPVMNIETVLQRRELIRQFIAETMKPGIDYGAIPGTGDRLVLLKAGAEKLTTLFGLTKRITLLQQVEDWDGHEHGGEPFFYYVYRFSLFRGERLIAEADGSCSSREAKYRYRQAQRKCPDCGQETIRKSKPPKSGWYCWSKLGGCGATFRAGDKRVEDQEVGRVPNPDIADQANTILKMAQKRAFMGVTLLGTSASEFFSQKEIPGMDDDDIVNGEYETVGQQPGEEAHQQEQSKPANGNGDVPNSPEKLYNVVNRRVSATYDSITHLFNAIKKELNWTAWPKPNDTVAWQQALDAAVKHARAKEQPEQAEQEEIAF